MVDHDAQILPNTVGPSTKPLELELLGGSRIAIECWFRPAPKIDASKKFSRKLSPIRVELENRVLREGGSLSGIIIVNVSDGVQVQNVYGLLRGLAKRDVDELLDDEDVEFLLFKNVHVCQTLAPGHHVFPFKFRLPARMTPTWNAPRRGACWVEYYMEAELVLKGTLKSHSQQYRQHFAVVRPALDVGAAQTSLDATAGAHHEFKGKMDQADGAVGTVGATIHLNRTRLGHGGDTVKVLSWDFFSSFPTTSTTGVYSHRKREQGLPLRQRRPVVRAHDALWRSLSRQAPPARVQVHSARLDVSAQTRASV